ncbi:MAG TPA: Hpt domain-containing protein [Thermoanaerobaculia bacterium]|nr:Hpt domain-containing protein [Thermoanaerobaculia bacterium]
MIDDLRALRQDYLQNVHETAARVRRQSQNLKTSFPELLFVAHQLKGSGGSLGFPRITELARRMSHELNLFFDPAETQRPTPEELSEKLIVLSHELDRDVTAAQRSLK